MDVYFVNITVLEQGSKPLIALQDCARTGTCENYLKYLMLELSTVNRLCLAYKFIILLIYIVEIRENGTPILVQH